MFNYEKMEPMMKPWLEVDSWDSGRHEDEYRYNKMMKEFEKIKFDNFNMDVYAQILRDALEEQGVFDPPRVQSIIDRYLFKADAIIGYSLDNEF